MTIKLDTLQLDGWQLDYFAGKALGNKMLISNDGAGPAYLATDTSQAFEPCSRPDHLYPVLLRMKTILAPASEGKPWEARAAGSDKFAAGATIEQAVCRALVLKVFGPTVEMRDVSALAEGPTPAPDTPAACDDLFA